MKFWRDLVRLITALLFIIAGGFIIALFIFAAFCGLIFVTS